jgi:ABC-2 type transport system permease protein
MPSFMPSGFMFLFRGMPVRAQIIGNVFPTTHAIRIVRGMLLKGNGWPRSAKGGKRRQALAESNRLYAATSS